MKAVTTEGDRLVYILEIESAELCGDKEKDKGSYLQI
jgi:hypothetical protein